MIWQICITIVSLCICLPLFLYYKRNMHILLASFFKLAGSLCALVPALIAAIRLDPRCWVCAAALMLYAVADFVLEFHFMLGAGIFLAGHILNISFFLSLTPVSPIHVICLIGFCCFSALVFFRLRKHIKKHLTMFIIYGISLVCLCASALGCYSLHSVTGILFAFGGSLFFMSDILIFRRLLILSDRYMDWAIMISYYSSILLFGIGCMYI